MNHKAFRVLVFGKTGCEKCKVLNKRLDDLLGKPEWADFEKQYCDVETEDGLVAFCRAECVNPNRIPALVVARVHPENGGHEYLPNPEPGTEKGLLYSVLGIQTDYSGSGVIPPKLIASVLAKARECVQVGA